MGEIIQINIGQTGINIGHSYLQKLIRDHYLETRDQNNKQAENSTPESINVSFQDISKQQVFRGIFIDIGSQNIDKILTSQQCHFINPNSIISSDISNTRGTFHNGQNLFNSEVQSSFEDILRLSTERCDRFEGFNLVHSTYDKCCGLSSSALSKFTEEYSSNIHCTTSIFPSTQCFNPIDIYNTTFGIHNLVENSYFTSVYDYDALERATKQLQQDSTLSNYNDIIAETILQLNCSYRFPGFHNGGLRKISTNLIPFPRVHFLTCSFSQISQKQSIFQQLYQLSCPFNSYYTYNQDTTNYYLTQAFIIRSKKMNIEVNQFNEKYQNQVEWIPDGFLHINCKVEHRDLEETAMHIGNQRRFGLTFKRIQEAFTASFRRKAFMHYYTQEGADEMEFTEAESDMNDLQSEYQDWGCCCQEEDEYEEEEQY